MSGQRVAGVLCLLVLAACGSATVLNKPTAFGIVTGSLMQGPPFAQPGIPGTVTFTANSGQQYTVKVSKSGEFAYRLPVGTYTANGASPYITDGATGAELRCYDLQPVHVEKDAFTSTTVTCRGP